MIGKRLVLEVELEGFAEVLQGSLHALPLAGDLYFLARKGLPSSPFEADDPWAAVG